MTQKETNATVKDSDDLLLCELSLNNEMVFMFSLFLGHFLSFSFWSCIPLLFFLMTCLVFSCVFPYVSLCVYLHVCIFKQERGHLRVRLGPLGSTLGPDEVQGEACGGCSRGRGGGQGGWGGS